MTTAASTLSGVLFSSFSSASSSPRRTSKKGVGFIVRNASSVDKFDDVERMNNVTRPHKVSSDDRHALDYRAPGFTVGENVSRARECYRNELF